jgi:acetylornithine/succinyldiaminopimelate/putrescine aminotransferase
MTEATPEQIVAFLTGAQAMTDIVERLRTMGYMPCIEAADEIEQLREHIAALQLVATAHDAEIARLRAALQIVREENDRAKRQFTNVSNKILDEACRALEPKP